MLVISLLNMTLPAGTMHSIIWIAVIHILETSNFTDLDATCLYPYYIL